MGNISPSDLCEKVEGLLKNQDVGKWESRIGKLSTQVRELQGQLERKMEETKRERRLTAESKELLTQIQNSVKVPGDALNKAKLFDEEVHKAGPAVAPKVVRILVEFGERMERTLFEIREALQVAGLYPDPKTGKAASQGKEEIPTPQCKVASPLDSEKSKGKSVAKEKTLQAPKAAFRLDLETRKGVTPGSQTKSQVRTEEQDQEMPQSKVSGKSSKIPSTVKRKATVKRAREVDSIDLESEEDESPEQSEKEEQSESGSGSEEDSESEASEPAEITPPKSQGKGKVPKTSKGKVAALAKVSTSRKQPACKGAAKVADSPQKKMKR